MCSFFMPFSLQFKLNCIPFLVILPGCCCHVAAQNDNNSQAK